MRILCSERDKTGMQRPDFSHSICFEIFSRWIICNGCWIWHRRRRWVFMEQILSWHLHLNIGCLRKMGSNFHRMIRSLTSKRWGKIHHVCTNNWPAIFHFDENTNGSKHWVGFEIHHFSSFNSLHDCWVDSCWWVLHICNLADIWSTVYGPDWKQFWTSNPCQLCDLHLWNFEIWRYFLTSERVLLFIYLDNFISYYLVWIWPKCYQDYRF